MTASPCVMGERGLHSSELSVLVDSIGHDSKAHQNYLDQVSNSFKKNDLISPMNMHCNQMRSLSDCDDLVDRDVLAFAQNSFSIILEENFISLLKNVDATEEVKQDDKKELDEAIQCSCVESSFFVSSGADFKTTKKVIDIKAAQVTEDVFKSYGKKFINEYAHQYEDAIYLLNHSNALSSQREKQTLCRGADQLESKIQQSCPHKSKKKINERIDLMFSEVDFGDARTLAARLDFIDYHTIHRKVKDRNGNDVTYLRPEYDKTRSGLKQTDEFKLLDKMLTGLLTRRDFHQLSKNSPTDSGLEIISKYMSDLLSKDFDSTMATLFDGKIPPRLVAKWQETRKSPSARMEFEQQFKKYFLNTAPSHPALASILLDPSTFASFMKHADGKNVSSVFNELENNFKGIETSMLDRCQKIVQDFADVVCVEDEDVLSGLSKESLKTFLDEKEEEYDLLGGIKDILSCRGGAGKLAGLQGLNKSGRNIINSDLHLFLNEKEKAQDSYSKFARDIAHGESKSRLISFAAQASSNSDIRTTSYNPMKNHLDRFKDSKIINAAGVVKDSSHEVSIAQSSVSRNSASLIKNNDMSSDSISIVASKAHQNNLFLPSYRTISEGKEGEDRKNSEILDFLAHREDKEVISSHISKLDNKELSELQNFKRNALLEKEKNLMKQIEDEKSSLERLKSEIDGLIAGKTVMQEASKAKKVSTTALEASNKGNGFVQPKSLSADLNDHSSSVAGRGNDSRSPASVTHASLNNASMASRSMGGEQEQASRANKVSAMKEATGVKKGLVLQEKTEIINSPKEISASIVEYLKSVDAETFIRFTEEGVVYKYKTIENGKVVEKEVHVSMNDVDPVALAEIVRESEVKLSSLQRKYSYETLKMIITEEALLKI